MAYDTGRVTICDVTQSYADKGGGVRTYLTQKRQFLLEQTNAKHCLIVPGEKDQIVENDRTIDIEIKSPRVPGSPNYRLLLRSNAVYKAFKQVRPDLIECQDAYNIPWTAVAFRRNTPHTALVAGYHTDFPNVYVEKYLQPRFGEFVAQRMKRISYGYAAQLYKRFDAFYTLTQIAAEHFAALGVRDPEIMKLGADTHLFHRAESDDNLRKKMGMTGSAPLLIYAGRIDREKRARIVVEAFKKLPPTWNAGLVMLGDGNEREALIGECDGWNAHFPGYVDDRETLATYLASSDIYVSGMEDETFGISVIEAQAAGLPVVGVRAGAMIDRVPPSLGRLGPKGDADTMAANIAAVWMDRLSPMGERAKAHAMENFSWPKTFEKLFFDLYPRAFEKRGAFDSKNIMQQFGKSHAKAV